VGPFTLKARSIDDHYKYGQWHEIEVAVMPSYTPSPLPSATPTPDNTYTPVYTPSPTPYPGYSLKLELDMPAKMFNTGDVFYLNAEIRNYESQSIVAPLVVLLDVHGQFFTWPSWAHLITAEDLDFETREYSPGLTPAEIIPGFTWPDVQGTQVGLVFYGMVISGDFSTLLSNLDMKAWGYGLG